MPAPLPGLARSHFVSTLRPDKSMAPSVSDSPPEACTSVPAETRSRSAFSTLLARASPPDLRILGRTLWHAALVGAAAGLIGATFFAGLELIQRLLLEEVAGYVPLRAAGETFAAGSGGSRFRPWLLLLLPAVGGLGCGLLARWAPETQGGGSDVMIQAFHRRGGVIRPRVIWVKGLASFCSLGTGGAGGREGPTMLIGGALGSLVARLLHVSRRERRILMVAGVAAGMSAVFRTPLGAALIAVEVLYRDGFESDALVPSVLASVIAYSVIISIFGETTLFGQVPAFPFHPAHLPLFALLALLVAALGLVFITLYRASTRFFSRLPVPDWMRPALGGLCLGLLAMPIIVYLGTRVHTAGQGLGILGGGYGAVQMAITGSTWLPEGWTAVTLLVGLSLTKVVASSLTIGSGGSAGDFAPSLVIGGLLGGAFGRAAQLLLDDPSIHPGAFALVGMSTFYGGIAHVPLSALVLACELARNYDLLVPLMLCQGIAFILLRRRTLYSAQALTQQDSPAHRDELLLDVLRNVRVRDLMRVNAKLPIFFQPTTRTEEIIRQASEATDQDSFPVVDDSGKPLGLVTTETMRVLAAELTDTRWTLAADLMQPFISVAPDDDLKTATELMAHHALHELPVVSKEGHVIGMLDESAVAALYLRAASRAETADRPAGNTSA